MPLFDVTINILLLCLIMMLSMVAGWFWRSKQLRKKERRIMELESEMLHTHAEILDTQREYCDLEARMNDLSIPVISIKQAGKEEDGENTPKTGEAFLRKGRSGRYLPLLIVCMLMGIPSRAADEKNSQKSEPFRHISTIFSLYMNGDTALVKAAGSSYEIDSRYVRKERNSDLVIAVPDAATGRYRLRFIDDQGRLVFEIKRLKDDRLTIEKYNFQRIGTFVYELYKDNSLIEKNSFTIKKD